MAGRKNHRYTFHERPHSAAGKLAFFLAVISAVCLLFCIGVSMARAGGAGNISAGIGLTAAALSVYGFAAGLRSFREKETLPLFSILGSVGCGIMTVIWLMIILSGM